MAVAQFRIGLERARFHSLRKIPIRAGLGKGTSSTRAVTAAKSTADLAAEGPQS